jgi:hypothetical protein
MKVVFSMNSLTYVQKVLRFLNELEMCSGMTRLYGKVVHQVIPFAVSRTFTKL